MIGIVSYGVYIPRYRIKIREIADAWKKQRAVVASLGVEEKAVAAQDEDAVTLAVTAAQQCLQCVKINSKDIQLVLVGSESHPYVVNPTATIVGDMLGLGNEYLAADLEFACKGATAGIELAAGLLQAKKTTTALIIGSDVAQSKPRDALEYTASSGGAAYLLGRRNVIAELIDYSSYSSDTPDFWRREGEKYPQHAGRFSGEPGYFRHVDMAFKQLLKKTGMKIENVNYCVFHMPNTKYPKVIAARLGLTSKQIAPALTVRHIGNPYTASMFIGLASVLDTARPGEYIVSISYGSGAGSDAFLWKTTKNITKSQKFRKQQKFAVHDSIQNKSWINYQEYLYMTGKI